MIVAHKLESTISYNRLIFSLVTFLAAWGDANTLVNEINFKMCKHNTLLPPILSPLCSPAKTLLSKAVTCLMNKVMNTRC